MKIYNIKIDNLLPIIQQEQLLMQQLMQHRFKDILICHRKLILIKNSSARDFNESKGKYFNSLIDSGTLKIYNLNREMDSNDLGFLKSNMCRDLVKYLLIKKEIILYNEA